MTTPPDSTLRNRPVTKQLDVGRRNNDATSDAAVDPAEAVQSPIHSFVQSPSSADRLRMHQGPLDNLVGAEKAAAAPTSDQQISVEDLQSELIDAGYSPGSIDGHFGPKTLEALNLFEQEQVDALKLQNNNLLSPAARVPPDGAVQRYIRQTALLGAVELQHLSSLANPAAKTVSTTQSTVLSGSDNDLNTLKNNDI